MLTDEKYQEIMDRVFTEPVEQDLSELWDIVLEEFEDRPDALNRMLRKYAPELLTMLKAEERLSGLKVEERLFGLKPEERLSGLKVEERLSGLKPEERLSGLKPEERLSGLKPEEMAAALSEQEREELLKVLTRQSKKAKGSSARPKKQSNN